MGASTARARGALSPHTSVAAPAALALILLGWRPARCCSRARAKSASSAERWVATGRSPSPTSAARATAARAHPEPARAPQLRRPKPWHWLLVALADVAGNYLLVLAYRFTTCGRRGGARRVHGGARRCSRIDASASDTARASSARSKLLAERGISRLRRSGERPSSSAAEAGTWLDDAGRYSRASRGVAVSNVAQEWLVQTLVGAGDATSVHQQRPRLGAPAARDEGMLALKSYRVDGRVAALEAGFIGCLTGHVAAGDADARRLSRDDEPLGFALGLHAQVLQHRRRPGSGARRRARPHPARRRAAGRGRGRQFGSDGDYTAGRAAAEKRAGVELTRTPSGSACHDFHELRRARARLHCQNRRRSHEYVHHARRQGAPRFAGGGPNPKTVDGGRQGRRPAVRPRPAVGVRPGAGRRRGAQGRRRRGAAAVGAREHAAAVEPAVRAARGRAE